MKPVELVKHEVYPQLYRIKYDDGVVSEEFYNKTRASDIIRNYGVYARAMENRSKTVEKHTPTTA